MWLARGQTHGDRRGNGRCRGTSLPIRSLGPGKLERPAPGPPWRIAVRTSAGLPLRASGSDSRLRWVRPRSGAVHSTAFPAASASGVQPCAPRGGRAPMPERMRGPGVFPHPQSPSGHPVSVPGILPADPGPQGGRVLDHRGHFSWNDRLRTWHPHGRTVSRTRPERHGTAGGSRSVERWMIQRWILASGPSRSSAESAALIRKGLLSTIPCTSAENRWSASFRLRTSWSIAGLSFRSTPLPRA